MLRAIRLDNERGITDSNCTRKHNYHSIRCRRRRGIDEVLYEEPGQMKCAPNVHGHGFVKERRGVLAGDLDH